LLPGVTGVGTNANSYVNGAWRPGVNKITFVPQLVDSTNGQFLPMTNQFTDTYITNGEVMHQPLQRIITKPDFLFCAGDVYSSLPTVPYVSQTGATNWINNSALNGNSTGAGHGIIQPQVRITFEKFGEDFYDDENSDESVSNNSTIWGTFDSSTNPPIIYPIKQNGTNQLTIRMWLLMGQNPPYQIQRSFNWSLTNSSGSVYLFQTSTNLADWVTLFSATNNGSIWTFHNIKPLSAHRFYRVVPQ
jgi:hypothetical protein